MGIESQAIRLLLLAREMGADLTHSLTIGRQDLLTTGPELREILSDFGMSISEEDASNLARGRNRFAEPLFERLGAKTVDSLDVSNFEGATIVHDLNQPHDSSLEQRFSLVFDSGTLEHVFNVPTALRTIMSLVRTGGYLLMAVPANNEMGHGFYQFSPDFFFRTLAPENGFEIKALFLAEPFRGPDWLAVRDPAAVRARVGFNTPRGPQYIFLIAQRVAAIRPFAAPPQQSDYAAEWSDTPSKGANANRLQFFDREMDRMHAAQASLTHKLVDHAPDLIRRPLHWLRAGHRLEERPEATQMVPFVARSQSAQKG